MSEEVGSLKLHPYKGVQFLIFRRRICCKVYLILLTIFCGCFQIPPMQIILQARFRCGNVSWILFQQITNLKKRKCWLQLCGVSKFCCVVACPLSSRWSVSDSGLASLQPVTSQLLRIEQFHPRSDVRSACGYHASRLLVFSNIKLLIFWCI